MQQRPQDQGPNDQDNMILEPKLVAPILAGDFTSQRGIWRNVTTVTSDKKVVNEDGWEERWKESTCKKNLIKNGTFALTMYSHSWSGESCE
mmetsp:Transcript_12489/g.21854  ORF Transcript_12489/g.21854 Transcript_12489/m.21854 type:complete len:91 (+) Transcript_12489:1601-1873(+)